MKRTLSLVSFIIFLGASGLAQEKFGRTLNLGFGIGYHDAFEPAVNINYEFDLFRNFTLAPFVGISTYSDNRYWGNYNTPYRSYYYRETAIPVGAKGSYYFDELFRAGDKWDFYVGTSIGAVFRTAVWESGYYGDKKSIRYSRPVFANMHVGSECHVTQKFGIYLDLSSGISTFGMSFHF